MWISNWQQMYICEDMRREPQWAEYEEICEEEAGMTEEEVIEEFERKFELPDNLNEAVAFIHLKARDGEMTDEEMAVGFFICGQIEAYDDLDGADKVFWEIENEYKPNKENLS